ncbi:HNH endonuclease [Nonomuraea roseoviolacea]|uniref:HNH endonuclease n=1 Tax=Nonomuraea roseoviolacea TaxID=103837 RepID=UPI003CD0B49D
MPRAKQICSTAGCRQTVKARGKCVEHDPGPWAGHTRQDISRLPSNWSTIRRRILRRDGYACYVCGEDATEVDHIDPGDNHDPSNLGAICARCHLAKTLRERQSPRLNDGG